MVAAASSGTGATVGISGYSNLAPSSHLKTGQQPGNGAVLLVFSSSNLHFGLASGSGPQSSTNSRRRGGLSSETTQVERPQNGCSSQVLPGSTVAHLVLAKHIPGKSKTQNKRPRSTDNWPCINSERNGHHDSRFAFRNFDGWKWARPEVG